jgi:hypothetical protein
MRMVDLQMSVPSLLIALPVLYARPQPDQRRPGVGDHPMDGHARVTRGMMSPFA